MSHIVTIKTELRDTMAISAACQRLHLLPPKTGRFPLFSGEAQGIGVQLPNWRFPVVCDTSSGELHYDNFQGRWGDENQLHEFLQAYAAENSKRSQCTSINGCM